MRDDSRMKVDQNWQMLVRMLFVNVRRFITELEALGYENLKSDDLTGTDVKLDEIVEGKNEIIEILNRDYQ